jgi:hypothetical protein
MHSTMQKQEEREPTQGNVQHGCKSKSGNRHRQMYNTDVKARRTRTDTEREPTRDGVHAKQKTAASPHDDCAALQLIGGLLVAALHGQICPQIALGSAFQCVLIRPIELQRLPRQLQALVRHNRSQQPQQNHNDALQALVRHNRSQQPQRCRPC